MRIFLIALLLACCVGVATAQENKPLIPEYFSGQFAFEGFSRTYALVPPKDFDLEKSYPLVVVFHGAGGSGIEMLTDTGLKDLASEQGYLIAFPNGVEQG